MGHSLLHPSKSLPKIKGPKLEDKKSEKNTRQQVRLAANFLVGIRLKLKERAHNTYVIQIERVE